MSHLVPTPIVDKNGVTSIRHMKPGTDTTSQKLPSPSLLGNLHSESSDEARRPFPQDASEESDSFSNPIARWMDKRQRTKLTDELTGELFAHDRKVNNYTDRRNFTGAVQSVLSTDEVKLALAVTRAVTRNDVPNEIANKDRTAVIQAVDSLTSEISGDRVRALHANMDWLRSNPGEAWKLNRLTNTLREYGIDAAGDNGKIPNLDAYLEAQLSPSYENVRRDSETHSEFLIGVATRPDNLDQLAAYVMERGFFDEDGFEQYLNTTTPLAEGSL